MQFEKCPHLKLLLNTFFIMIIHAHPVAFNLLNLDEIPDSLTSLSIINILTLIFVGNADVARSFFPGNFARNCHILVETNSADFFPNKVIF